MNYSTYRFTLDIHQVRAQVSIPVFFQDTWVRFLINLTDGGKPYTLEEVGKATLFGKKADGTALVEDCLISDDNTRIEYTFSEQTASAFGPVECEIRLYSKSGRQLTSPSFTIVVEERVIRDEDIIESVSNPSAIDRILESEEVIKAAATKAEEEADRAEEAASKATAGGATFTPHVSAEGVLSWTNDKELDNPDAVDIRGPQGERGQKGDGFSISKTYASVAAMNADYANSAVPLYGFVLIDTGNVEDADNAKLYVKKEGGFSYLTDLSGAQGIKGEQGDKGATGATGPQGPQGATGDKGEKGDKGDKGEPGEKGADGAKGADGTSLTVSSVHESTADGGYNVVVFSDGKSLTIMNGSKGSKGDKGDKGDTGATGATGPQGATGAAGYTPVKGKDYFTDADKEDAKGDIVQALIAELQGLPVFGVVDANNIITVTSQLSGGTYTLKYENENGALEEIGTIIVGTGTGSGSGGDEPIVVINLADPTSAEWKTNKRINSSKNEVAIPDSSLNGQTMVITNTIDITGATNGTKFHFKGLNLLATTGVGASYNRIYFYDESKVYKGYWQPTGQWVSNYVNVSDYDENVQILSNIQQLMSGIAELSGVTVKYITFGAVLTGTAEDVVIAKDTNIV